MGHATPKQFLPLAGVPVIVHTIRAMAASAGIGPIILVVPEGGLNATREILAAHGLDQSTHLVVGGRLRQDSVEQGLAAVPAGVEYTIVHDGARPLVTPELVQRCLAEARRSGAAIAALPVKDTLKAVNGENLILKTVDRHGLWQAQTPQAARTDLLRQAHATARESGFTGTDEASLLARINIPVSVVEGAEINIKITRPGDLEMAEAILAERTTPAPRLTISKIGHGYDAHRLVADRPLVLGGVTIAHDRGLLGHSDADVLTHALCDAILGAAGLGDIGRHFPDTDPTYAGINSLLLLRQVMNLVRNQGFSLTNADITVIAQGPKLTPHFPAMQELLATACGTPIAAVNLKATTTEGLGFAGRGEGMAAHAVVLLTRNTLDNSPAVA
jgi:2-C-methyl-D-erythritol 4-phosphate cytidylyltransferase/2-C-methyl-D-erythritol 2,4-cyclodiphosphate synthase